MCASCALVKAKPCCKALCEPGWVRAQTKQEAAVRLAAQPPHVILGLDKQAAQAGNHAGVAGRAHAPGAPVAGRPPLARLPQTGAGWPRPPAGRPPGQPQAPEAAPAPGALPAAATLSQAQQQQLQQQLYALHQPTAMAAARLQAQQQQQAQAAQQQQAQQQAQQLQQQQQQMQNQQQMAMQQQMQNQQQQAQQQQQWQAGLAPVPAGMQAAEALQQARLAPLTRCASPRWPAPQVCPPICPCEWPRVKLLSASAPALVAV